MYLAQLHHKLAVGADHQEDLLTSNALGVWRYLPNYRGLKELLNTAVTESGEPIAIPNSYEVVSVDFWPALEVGDGRSIEPDVLVTLESPNEGRWLVIVEVKYKSPKSSDPTNRGPVEDQLGKQLLALRFLRDTSTGDRYSVIYLTEHSSVPRREIIESLTELSTKIGIDASLDLGWIPWAFAARELDAVYGEFSDAPWLQNLVSDSSRILSQSGIRWFDGIKPFGRLNIQNYWSFCK